MPHKQLNGKLGISIPFRMKNYFVVGLLGSLTLQLLKQKVLTSRFVKSAPTM